MCHTEMIQINKQFLILHKNNLSEYNMQFLYYIMNKMWASVTAKPFESRNVRIKVMVLEWPSQRLDLNPSQMLWPDLKQAVHKAIHKT